jgi:hypothetical protein
VEGRVGDLIPLGAPQFLCEHISNRQSLIFNPLSASKHSLLIALPYIEATLDLISNSIPPWERGSNDTKQSERTVSPRRPAVNICAISELLAFDF